MKRRKNGVLEKWSDGVLESWRVGVLEYWSIGVLESWIIQWDFLLCKSAKSVALQ